MEHQTIDIKVNACVDKKVAPLVIALNRIKGIFTVDSCQGYSNKPAYVYFKYGSSPKDLAVFCSILAKQLSTSVKGSNKYSLRVEWNFDFSANMAVLMTSPKNIHKLVKAIQSMTFSHHKNLSFYDK